MRQLPKKAFAPMGILVTGHERSFGFQAAACGCHIVTVPHDILAKATKLGGMDLDELSLDTVRVFHADAVAAGFQL